MSTHIVFSIKHRQPLLQDRQIHTQLHAYLTRICRQQECPSLIVGGVADHIHTLCHFGRTATITDLVKEIKRYSSLWIKEQGQIYRSFAWQGGYGAFSVGYLQINTVRKYIKNQEVHHQSQPFPR